MDSVQELIHKLEEGAGARYIKLGALALLVVGLVLGYNWRCFRNLGTLEAMDAAQVGRNLSEGKGFSTLFVRPFSIYLLTNHAGLNPMARTNERPVDVAQLKGMHPDLANPPLYPLLLAGLWKVAPAWWAITETETGAPLWNKDGRFYWYSSDFYLAILNQALLLLTVWLSYRLALRVFDARVALLVTLLLLGTELLWQFSVSGLSTNLLVTLFMGLALCLWNIEAGVRENTATANRLAWLAALAGLLVGLAGLTRYAMLCLIAPVLFYLVMYSGQRRFFNAALAASVFLVVIAPWLIRNERLSGTPFGTATYAYLETSPGFPRADLQRNLGPNLQKFNMGMFWRKVVNNTRTLVNEDLPKLGGTWMAGFFLVSLLLSFRNPGITRLKFFLVACIILLGLVQAVGRTHLSQDSPVLNSENLLVVVTPLLILFGVALYRVLRDQLKVPSPEIRVVVDIVFVAVLSLPMIFALWPPRVDPRQYPPYYPPLIQRVSGWMTENELTMSDIPWAVAWYGQRQCIWLTTNPAEQYFAIEDDMKPIKALYLTPRTTDARFISDLADTEDRTWGNFIVGVAILREVPKAFPLQNSPETFPVPQQIFLTDRVRWQKPKAPGP
jgi:4-amino-4-deoxy-L-arabinose transferase-like glycosyltransferase